MGRSSGSKVRSVWWFCVCVCVCVCVYEGWVGLVIDQIKAREPIQELFISPP